MLSAADDSQRAALRTPRVLNVTMPYLMPYDGSCQQQQHPRPTPTATATATATTVGGGGPVFDWRTAVGQGQRRPRSGSDLDCRHPSCIFNPITPPCVSADVAARLVLAQLLPQRPGDNMTAAFAAFFAAGAAAAGVTTSASAPGTRGDRPAGAGGSWCSGLEFDLAGGGPG